MSKPTIIIGLGKTGLSCVRYLAKQQKPFIVLDTSENPPGLIELKEKFPQIPYHLGSLDANLLCKASEIIVSPGVPLDEPALIKAKAAGIPIISDIEVFVRNTKVPIVAITGTNAKGTVTTLVGDMVHNAGHKVIVAGNIGTPVLDLLSENSPEFYVLELSSFQLESTYSLQAVAATILNVSDDHLDRHHTMEAYIAAKQRVYEHCQAAIYNRDDAATHPAVTPSTIYSFGLTEPKPGEFGIRNVAGQIHLAYGAEILLAVDELKIKGRHNWANALAALALGTAIKLPLPAMLQALREFKGLHHRCEWLTEVNGVTWYDDSKGTNVGATIAAIEGLGSAINGKLILIAGGLGKGANFEPLQAPVSKYVRDVILIGQDAPILERALNTSAPIHHAVDLKAAVMMAKSKAQAKDAVLLSPACASFDMFQNYEHRGEVFKSLVKEIVK